MWQHTNIHYHLESLTMNDDLMSNHSCSISIFHFSLCPFRSLVSVHLSISLTMACDGGEERNRLPLPWRMCASAYVCVLITFIAHKHNRAFEMDILLTGGHIAVCAFPLLDVSLSHFFKSGQIVAGEPRAIETEKERNEWPRSHQADYQKNKTRETSHQRADDDAPPANKEKPRRLNRNSTPIHRKVNLSIVLFFSVQN